MQHKLTGADAPVDLIWDKHGFAHVFAGSVADAYRGMGYAAASERLWQIHLSTAYANSEAAALLGERFVAQDVLQRACNVDGRETTMPASDGDWIAQAYVDGMNSFIAGLDEVPPEFAHAGAEPRPFTLRDIAARYRFTCWFQHRSWSEKMLIGRLMATHGADWFEHHVLHFQAEDRALIEQLQEPLSTLDLAACALAYPESAGKVAALSGSNNWAVTGALSASGRSMLATDPHQPHSIPNTFFYVHLHAPDFDVFGAAFPGVPYFMMGRTPHTAWGLTTGCVDTYDIYVEQVRDRAQRRAEGWQALGRRELTIDVRGEAARRFELDLSTHGPLLEPLCGALGFTSQVPGEWQTALSWSFADVPTSAGALARLPLARTAQAFGEALFEDDVCPLVNNIICVDADDGLERYIAATLAARKGTSGSVPLPGWDPAFDFRGSTAQELVVEKNPVCGFTLTANNDTMGTTGPFPIHTFPTFSARADRIRQMLEAGERYTVDDFKQMQLDQLDLRAGDVLAELLPVLERSDEEEAKLAHGLLAAWDQRCTATSAAACLFYPFLDRFWPRRFMREVLGDEVLGLVPVAAQAWNRFDVKDFLAPGSPWRAHQAQMEQIIVETMSEVVSAVRQSLGDDPGGWRWGDLHQIQFAHRLHEHPPWQGMSVGPDPAGGSGTTLNMALHLGPGPGRAQPGEIANRVYHGPAFRMVVDLAEPDRVHFVVAGGNGGRAGSAFATNQYAAWLAGDYVEVMLDRAKIDVQDEWRLL